MSPGRISTTRIGVLESSTRNPAVNALRADFAALYGAMKGMGNCAASDVTLMIVPRPRWRMAGSARRINSKGASTSS